MSGIMTGQAPCYVCDTIFGFDVLRVPCVEIDPTTNRPSDVGPDGEYVELAPQQLAETPTVQRVICPSCARTINRQRKADGLDPLLYEGDTLADLMAP